MSVRVHGDIAIGGCVLNYTCDVRLLDRWRVVGGLLAPSGQFFRETFRNGTHRRTAAGVLKQALMKRAFLLRYPRTRDRRTVRINAQYTRRIQTHIAHSHSHVENTRATTTKRTHDGKQSYTVACYRAHCTNDGDGDADDKQRTTTNGLSKYARTRSTRTRTFHTTLFNMK